MPQARSRSGAQFVIDGVTSRAWQASTLTESCRCPPSPRSWSPRCPSLSPGRCYSASVLTWVPQASRALSPIQAGGQNMPRLTGQQSAVALVEDAGSPDAPSSPLGGPCGFGGFAPPRASPDTLASGSSSAQTWNALSTNYAKACYSRLPIRVGSDGLMAHDIHPRLFRHGGAGDVDVAEKVRRMWLRAPLGRSRCPPTSAERVAIVMLITPRPLGDHPKLSGAYGYRGHLRGRKHDARSHRTPRGSARLDRVKPQALLIIEQ